MLKKKYFCAFTLIELLLAITILLLIGTMSFYFLRKGKKENDLKIAQREVAATIKLTQSYVLQGKSTSSSAETPCGFGFRFKDSKTYEIFYIKPSGANTCSIKNDITKSASFRSCSSSGSDCVSFETFALKNNITLQGATDQAEIYFTIPHANPFDKNGADYSPHVLTLGSPSGTENKKIDVDSSGSVSEEK
jgi:type II secretory pathway pseudopilin PulG